MALWGHCLQQWRGIVNLCGHQNSCRGSSSTTFTTTRYRQKFGSLVYSRSQFESYRHWDGDITIINNFIRSYRTIFLLLERVCVVMMDRECWWELEFARGRSVPLKRDSFQQQTLTTTTTTQINQSTVAMFYVFGIILTRAYRYVLHSH